jgi:hypothetical protein
MRKLIAALLILIQANNAMAGSQTLLKGDILEAAVSGRIGTTGAPDTKAVLDLVSTTLGFLPPRMSTAQKTAIASPPTGLIVYDTTLNALQVYNGTTWVSAGGGGITYAADTGSANAYAIAPTPAATAYTTGDIYAFKVANANTTSSTLNVSSLGAKNIKTPQIANLLSGALAASMIALVVYDGTQFQLINQQDPTRVSPLTTKGDTHTFSTVDVRQAVPGDYGRLVPDSGAATGWRSASYTQFQNGSPTVNYIQYADFENGATTGWTATGCATITAGLPNCPGTGGAAFSSSNGGRTKGSNTSSPAVDSSSNIAGTYSMNLATTGAGTAGDGYVSSAYTLDPKVRGGVLSYMISYKVASGTPVQQGTSSDTYAVAAYSPAENTFITLSNPFCITKSSGVGTCQGLVTTNTATTSLQFFVYSPVAPSGASSLLFDDVSFGLWLLSQGPPITDTTSTTTLTPNNFGTISLASYFYYRHADRGHFYGSFKSGTEAAATASISLPTGLVIDSSKLTTTVAQRVGEFSQVRTAAGPTNSPPWDLFYDGSDTAKVYVAFQTGSNVFTKVNASALISNNDSVSFEFDVPVVGWSSNVQMASSTNNGITSQRLTSGTSATYNTPAGVKWLEIWACGGGGGGGGSGTTAGSAATSGGDTTWVDGSTTLVNATGGFHGSRDGSEQGNTAVTVTSPAFLINSGLGNQPGQSTRHGSAVTSATPSIPGGVGGNSWFGGGGYGGMAGQSGDGGNGQTNTGGGGGGAYAGSTTSNISGSGGNAGSCVWFGINNPKPTYTYTIGSGGTGQVAGASGGKGGNGAAGIIIVKENYLPNPSIGIDNDSVTTQSANYTAQVTDRTIIFTADATLSLPAAAQVKGRKYTVIASGVGTDVTIDPNGSETVCGSATKAISGTNVGEIQSDGSNWQDISGFCGAVVMRASLTTAQTGVTDKVIPFNNVLTDTHGCMSGGTCTVKVAGNYEINCHALLANSGTPNNDRIWIQVNGSSTALRYCSNLTASTTSTSCSVSDIYPLALGDTVNCFVDGDASFDIDNSGDRTLFSLHRIF